MCLQFLRLLTSSSSLLACPLGSAISVNSKIIDIMDRNSDTVGIVGRIPSRQRSPRLQWMEEASGHLMVPCGHDPLSVDSGGRLGGSGQVTG